MKGKNYYPLGIAIFFGIMCCGIILTIYISLKYKPDYDNAYFSTRQVVDKDINAILVAQNELESRYKFYVLDSSGKNALPLTRKANRKSNALFVPSEAILRFKITDLKGKAAIGESVRLYITRFADSSADKDIGVLSQKNGIFISPEISFEKGEWKLLVEFSIDDKKAYFEQRIVFDDNPNSEKSAKQKPKKPSDYAINHNLA